CGLLVGLLQAQPNVTVTLMPYKDGQAAADLTKNGTNGDLLVRAGSPKSHAWMTFRMQDVDRSAITKATLTLYVKTVTTAGKFQVHAPAAAFPVSESAVTWDMLSTPGSGTSDKSVASGD